MALMPLTWNLRLNSMELTYDIPVKFVPQRVFSDDEEPFIAKPNLTSSCYSVEVEIRRKVKFEYTSGSDEEVLVVKRNKRSWAALCETYWKSKPDNHHTHVKPVKRMKLSEEAQVAERQVDEAETIDEDDDRECCVIVSELPPRTTETVLREMFAKFGVIEAVFMQGLNATLKFINPISAGAALTLNGAKLRDKFINVRLSNLQAPKITVLIANLAPNTDPAKLLAFFPKVKHLKNVHVVSLNRSQSQAYLTFPDVASAQATAAQRTIEFEGRQCRLTMVTGEMITERTYDTTGLSRSEAKTKLRKNGTILAFQGKRTLL